VPPAAAVPASSLSAPGFHAPPASRGSDVVPVALAFLGFVALAAAAFAVVYFLELGV